MKESAVKELDFTKPIRVSACHHNFIHKWILKNLTLTNLLVEEQEVLIARIAAKGNK